MINKLRTLAGISGEISIVVSSLSIFAYLPFTIASDNTFTW